MRVDVPDPDGPMIAANPLAGKSMSIPFNAAAGALPEP